MTTPVEKTCENNETSSETVENSTPDAVFNEENKPLNDDIKLNPPESNSKTSTRLCGYLNKLGNQKILKTFRKRWFVFCESNCKLYYYRSPHDQVPLGEIDISQATFAFEVNKERTGLFTISIPGRDYYLEANNRQTCLYWLQELQKHRRANSLLRTKRITDQSTSNHDLEGHPQSGLLARLTPELNPDELSDDMKFFSPIECPTDAIGDDLINENNHLHLCMQPKFSVFQNSVRTSASFIKHDKSPLESSPNSLSKEATIIEDKPLLSSSSSLSPSETTTNHSHKMKAQGLSSFKLKISSSFRKSRLRDGHDSFEDNLTNSKESCQRCYSLDAKIQTLVDDISALQEEISISREVQGVLKRQLDIVSKEKETLTHIYQLNDSQECLKLLSEKDNQIVNLSHDILEKKQEVETLQRHIISLKSEVTELQKNNDLYHELIIQKDKTIMSLTNDVFDLETERRDQKMKFRSNSDSIALESSKPIVEPKTSLSTEDLKDAIEAFEIQNKFLNKEILEINQLRRDAEDRVQLLYMKCSEWEARCYQIQSKLLFLLNEFNKPNATFNQDIITQLLKEAMGETATYAEYLPTWSSERLYDELGFNWRWGKDDLLSTKANNLMQKSENITNKSKDPDLITWRTKWDNFIVSLGSKELQRSPELKLMLRTGIPNEYRGKIWKGCLHMWIRAHKSLLGPNYYNSLLITEEASRLDPSSKQIELDLLRTLPNNIHYENLDSDGIPKLRRVLLAYSRYDPAIGYCQGLNRLAAIALLFMDEEDAFWGLVAITKFIMPDGYYSRTLIAAQVDQRVLKDLMADKLPRVCAHFEQNNVDLSLFTFNWFLTVFVDNIPVETYLRIWDVFVYEGSKVLFRYALAFFKMYENEILQLSDYMAINKFVRTIAERKTDLKKLTHIAFSELNPFPQRTINSKRAQHMQIVKAQLEEFESIRQTLPRSDNKIPNMDNMSEED